MAKNKTAERLNCKVRVSYKKSIESCIDTGEYDLVDPNINSSNFPAIRHEELDITVRLLCFNKSISTNEAIHKITKMGYRPAGIRELLAFCEKCPEAHFRSPIIALGYAWRTGQGDCFVPVFHVKTISNKLVRYLHLVSAKYNWEKIFYFAIVPKKNILSVS